MARKNDELDAHVANDPEVNSEFAATKALAKEQGTAKGIDPTTGERASISYRQLFNETGGDAKKAEEMFRDIARRGGYGDVQLTDDLDIRSLSRSVEENKALADRAEDLFGRRMREQQAQHQDNVLNDVNEALRRLEKG
jgi:hypothetical protein